MKMSRRKIVFTVAWVVALAAIGMGVASAIPSSDGERYSIALNGSAVIERPEGVKLFTLPWGDEQGQIGLDEWEGGAPSQYGMEAAVAADGAGIGILDYANSRVEVFSRDGQLQYVVPVEPDGGLADIAFGSDGQLLVLTYGGTVFSITPTNAQTPMRYEVAEGVWPYELTVDGPVVWVKGMGDVAYQVVSGGSPVDAAEQPSTAQVGVPAGGASYQVLLKNRGQGSCVIRDANKEATKVVEIVSADLPFFEIRSLGIDANGGFYAMANIWEEGWVGTESWDFFGITASGTYLGHVRLPVDFWAGGSWNVTPDGKILEVRSTQAGVEVIEHALEVQQ